MAKVTYGASISALRGRAGSVVHSEGVSGPVVRTYSAVNDPHTPLQLQRRQALIRAAAAYQSLTAAQFAAWQAYALGLTRHNDLTGQTYTPQTYNVFSGLAVKFLQINPAGSIPLLPPTSGFVGDAITVTAAGAHGEVIFTASGGNAAGVKTELLWQILPTARRKPDPEKYRTRQFYAFSGLFHTAIVFTSAGWYAPAYRFVNVATGQMTGLVTLPTVQVT